MFAPRVLATVRCEPIAAATSRTVVVLPFVPVTIVTGLSAVRHARTWGSIFRATQPPITAP
jgi:hypothetical protein